MSTDAKKDRAGTYAIRVSWKGNKNYRATLVDGKYTVTAAPAPDPAPARVSGTPTAKMTAKGKTGLVLRWNRIEGADGYDIFFAKCNHHGRNIACKRVKSIKGNKTFKSKVKKVRKNRKLMPKSHAAKLRYMTSDSRIATVSAGGRITAKGKGTCTIVAFAHNGVSRSIEVVVK